MPQLTNGPVRTARRANFRVRSVLQGSPSLLPAEVAYSAVLALLSGKRRTTRHELAQSQLLLDGCQGSGNTFLAAALSIALDRDFRLAHHLHSASMAIAAGQSGTPCLIVVREPSQCCLSIASKFTYVTIRDALRHWTRYHATLLRRPTAYQMVSFNDVERNVNDVLGAIEAWLGTGSLVAPLRDADLFQLRRHANGNSPLSAMRLARKRQLACLVQDAELQPLHARARQTYQQLIDSPNWLLPPFAT